MNVFIVSMDLFSDTATILNLFDLMSIMGCPGGMSTRARSAFSLSFMVFHRIFLGKKVSYQRIYTELALWRYSTLNTTVLKVRRSVLYCAIVRILALKKANIIFFSLLSKPVLFLSVALCCITFCTFLGLPATTFYISSVNIWECCITAFCSYLHL